MTEFSLKYKDNLGMFVRGSGLYDFYVMGNHTERSPLTHDAKDVVGSYTRLLDAFGYCPLQSGRACPPSCASAGRWSTGARAPSSRGASTRSTTST